MDDTLDGLLPFTARGVEAPNVPIQCSIWYRRIVERLRGEDPDKWQGATCSVLEEEVRRRWCAAFGSNAKK